MEEVKKKEKKLKIEYDQVKSFLNKANTWLTIKNLNNDYLLLILIIFSVYYFLDLTSFSHIIIKNFINMIILVPSSRY